MSATRRCFSSQSFARAKVVVVGSGRMGQIRSSLLYANPRFDLVGIVDVNFEGATALAQKYEAEAFRDLEEAIAAASSMGGDSRKLQGVIVSTPTHTHSSIITESTNHGISVFTEKPVDETAEQIRKLFDVASNKIDLCCGFQRRFDPSYAAAAETIQSGSIGAPVSANIIFADHPVPPKEFLLYGGGNIIMDLAPHDVDFIMCALQDEVISVYATGSSSTSELEAAGIHDNATMMMKFSKGTIATLYMSRSAAYGYDQRCEIFGETGKVAVENQHDNSTVLANSDGIRQSVLQHSFPQRFQQAFANELDAFADTLLLDNKPWPITASDCIRVQKVADAARLSIELDQPVSVTYE
mmetsp:Transcript_2015/g.2964  ORF Transcript_2015/g.2964 Transcript_2015/m.2964 type:complete len:355 (+) Transcript_2015:297-1361(+)